MKQEIRWRVPVGNSRFGGTLSTASNLVFQVAPDGRLMAYSAEKGEQLLELPTGLRNGMGPPITFAIDGKQYIALMGGTGGTASLGIDQPGSRDHTAEAHAVGVWPRWQGRAAQTRRRACSHRRGSSLKPLNLRVFRRRPEPIDCGPHLVGCPGGFKEMDRALDVGDVVVQFARLLRTIYCFGKPVFPDQN